MFNKHFKKTKKRGKRVMPFVLAASMLMQIGMSNVAFADGITGESVQVESKTVSETLEESVESGFQTESVANTSEESFQTELQTVEAAESSVETEEQNTTVSEESDGSADESKNTQAETEETETREAIDWTQHRESFLLSPDKIVYQEKEELPVTVKNIGDRLDMSGVKAEMLESQHLFVRFLFDSAEMTEELKAGDTFSFIIPKEYMAVEDTNGPVAVSACNRQAYEAEPSQIMDTESFGSYEIKSNVVTFTVTEIPQSGNMFGVIDIAFEWNPEKITADGTSCELIFQEGVKTRVEMPKRAEEDIKESYQTDKIETDETVETEKFETVNEEGKAQTESVSDEKKGEMEESDGNVIKRFYRSIVNFFTTDGEASAQNYAGGTSSSHTFGPDVLPVGFSQVKVTVNNKNGGYQTGDDLRVGFKFNLMLDEDYLYEALENDIMKRADYPVQGSLTDSEYEIEIGKYLNALMEAGELSPLEYSYDLGEDFREYSNDEPTVLYDSTDTRCGEFIVLNGVVSFSFDGSCYFYDDIVASISMEAKLNEGIVGDDPVDIVFGDHGELVHQSVGSSGGGSGETEDNNYYIEKEAPVRVTNSEIIYKVTVGVLNDKEKLNGLQVVDTLPEGLELKSVFYGDKELTAPKDYTYDPGSRTFTYLIEALNDSGDNPITEAEFTLTAKLTDDKYQEVINSGEINEDFSNKAELRKDGEAEPLDVSDEVTTNMKFTFMNKQGQEEQLNGTRYSWTISANTQLPYLEYGYLVDTLCWTDHQYDFDRGITVHTKNGDIVYHNIPRIEGGLPWEELTAEGLKAIAADGPFYYLYDSTEKNPFYGLEGEPEYKQMAILVLPFDYDDGWTGTTTQEALRVKYFTDLNLHGMTMDEYLLKVKQNESLNPEITNMATLLWHNRDGKGPGPVLPENVTWDKTGTSNVKAVSKTGVSYNEKTQEVTWKLDVNRYGASLQNVVIEDELQSDYDLKASNELTINMRKYNQANSAEVEDSPMILTKAQSGQDLTPGTYTITENADGKKVIRIALGDLVSWDEGTAVHYCCILDFKLKLTDPDYLAKQDMDQSVSNNAKITATLNEKPFEDISSGSIKVPNQLIDKTAVGSYDYQTHKLTWQIEINPNKLPIENAKITDTLPEDIEWAKLTGIKKNGEIISESQWESLINVETSGSKQTKLIFKDAISDTYTFTFESSVTEQWRKNNQEQLASDGFVNVENEAKLNGTIYGQDITGAMDIAENTINHVKVGKSGIYNKEEGTIAWTVLMNVDQADISGMHLVEDLTGNNNVHELDINSITVEKVQIDENGNVLEDSAEVVDDPDLCSIDANTSELPDRRGFALYLSASTADHNTYRITFKTELLADAPTGALIQNKVYLKKDNDDTYDESDSNDGGYGGDFVADNVVSKSTRPKITMTKASDNSVNLTANDQKLLLEDAEFLLTAYTFTADPKTKTITLKEEAARYNKDRTTDTYGDALFLNIKAKSSTNELLIYKLEETKAPAGYKQTEATYLIFADAPAEYGDYTTINDSTKTVSLKNDENYFVRKAASDNSTDTTAALTLTDKPIDSSFAFGKKVATGVDYSGVSAQYNYGPLTNPGKVVFKITPMGSLANKIKTQYVSNDADGNITIKNLDPGTYKLTEVASPIYMTIGAEYTLDVKPNESGSCDYIISGASNHNTELSGSEIRNGYLLGSFSFTKQVQYEDLPENGTNPKNNTEKLQGAAFQLESTKIAGTVNETFVQTVVSDSSGTVSFKDIPVGEYRLTEGTIKDGVFEPKVDGYSQKDSVKVVVSEEEDKNNQLGTSGTGTPYYDKKVKVIYQKNDESGENPEFILNDVYTNTAIKGKISFQKISDVGDTGLQAFSDNPLFLEGAEFGLYRKIGTETAEKPTYTATSDVNGMVQFEDVEYSDYVLREIAAPAGYKTTDDISLYRSQYQVNADNNSFECTVTSSGADEGKVKDALKTYSVQLMKQNQDGSPLADKKFYIYRRNSGAIGADGSGLNVDAGQASSYYLYQPLTQPQSTNTQGFLNLDKLPYGDYLLVEDIQEGNLIEGYLQPAVHISIGTDSNGTDKITVRMTHQFSGELETDHYTELSPGVVARWNEIQLNDGSYNIVNQVKYFYIQTNKVAGNEGADGSLRPEEDTKIEGVKFAVYEGSKAEGTPYLTVKTNSTGQFETNSGGAYQDAENPLVYKHLFVGKTYTIKELSAPEEFVTASNSAVIDGTAAEQKDTFYVWRERTSSGQDQVFAQKGEVNKSKLFVNTYARSRIILNKKDAENADVKLDGAEFHIKETEGINQGKVVAVLKDAGDGRGIYRLAPVPDTVVDRADKKEVNNVELDYLYNTGTVETPDYQLLTGNYIIEETKAPDGYEKAVQIIPETGNRIQISADGDREITISLDETAIRLDIVKKAAGTNETLTGEIFKVTGKFKGSDAVETKTLAEANTEKAFLGGETYTLHEEKAPLGYLAGVDVEVKFNVLGEVESILPEENSPVQLESDKQTLVYTDFPIDIRLQKENESGTLLSGAEFLLEGKFAQAGVLEAEDREVTVRSGADSISLTEQVDQVLGTVGLRLAQRQTYTLTETKAADGFKLTEPVPGVSFTVNEDGTVSFQETGDVKGNGSNTVTVTNHPITLKLEKKDKVNSEQKDGAVVKVTDVTDSANNVSREIEIENGDVTWPNTDRFFVSGHTYEISEKSAPTGYVTPAETEVLVRFTVQDDGSLSMDTANDYPLAGIQTDESRISTVTIQNERQTGEITIKKVNADSTEEGLAGAVFRLYKDGSSQALVINSGNGSTDIVTEGTEGTLGNGFARISGLEWGEYVLKEITPPEGYMLDPVLSTAGLSFTIDAENLNPVITSGSVTGSVTNTKNIFTLKKADAFGTPLGGAQFTLVDITDPTRTVTLDASKPSEQTLTGILVAGHTYELEETVAPDGYIRETAAVRFEMKKDGTIAKVQEADWTNTGYSLVVDADGRSTGIQLKDEPIVFALVKTDAESGSGQEGVEFKITPKDGSSFAGSTETFWSGMTGPEGILEISELLKQGNSYTVHEEKALAGYSYAEDFDITVDMDGNVTVGKVAVTSENPYPVTDNKLNIQIFKKDDVEQGIGNISFTLQKENSEPEISWNLISGENGLLKVDDGHELSSILEAGHSYILTETETENSPYVLLKAPVKIQINRDGLIDKTALETDNPVLKDCLTLSDDDLNLSIKNERTSLSIRKTDEKGQLLKGASLGIYYDIQGEIGDLVTLDENPLEWSSKEEQNYDLRGLPTGIYWLKETGAPEGYITAEPTRFEINSDGTVEIKNQQNEIEAEPITMIDEPVVGHFVLKKTLAGSETTVKGAVFDLYEQKGDAPADTDVLLAEGIITGDDGRWESVNSDIQRKDDGTKTLKDGLLYGKYYLKETSTTESCQLNTEPIQFTIEGKMDGDTVVLPDVKQVDAENEPYQRELCVEKQDEEDKTVLEGAVFSLRRIRDDAGNDVTEDASEAVTNNDGRAAFTITKKGTYKLTEIEAPKGYIDVDSENTLYEKEFTVDDSTEVSILLEEDGTENIITNGRKTGTLTLLKQDVLDGQALDGVVFTLYKKNEGNVFQNIYNFLTGNAYSKVSEEEWNEQVNAEGKLTISGLTWGDYYIEETLPLAGYIPEDTKYEFTVGRYQSDIILNVDKGIIENTQTEIRFGKVGLYNESCSDTALGAPSSEAVQIMEGVTFTAYTDPEMDEASKAAEAVSDSNGEVVFRKLAIGTYYIKETALPEDALAANYKLDEKIYVAVIDANGQFAGLQTTDGTSVANNTIVNDVERTDIVIEKVDEKNPDRKLPGALYGLFKRGSGAKRTFAATSAESDEWIQVAQASTDEKGILKFSGVLMDTEYQIRELKAPDGSYVSGKPLTITFKMIDGIAGIQSFDDGNGTTKVDPETGEIIWKEPQVEVEFAKKDEGGKLLAGAKLEVQDLDGNVIESWMSSAQDTYRSYGKLISGKTYRLVETEAPEGYEIAEPVEFTIPSEAVEADQNKVIQIEMTDKKTPVKETPEKPGKDDKTDKPVNSVKTGDLTNIWQYIILLATSAIVLITLVIYKKKHK